MRSFLITARTATMSLKFVALARCSCDAAMLASDLLNGQAGVITVVAGVR